jgi:hypothetical protein
MNRKVIYAAVLACALAVVGVTSSVARSATALPTPKAFVSNLDLECFPTDPFTPTFPPILTHHLNPVLAGLPDEKVTLGVRQQLCVPVAKNGVIPPADVLNFIKYVDLSCYQIQGINVNKQLNLTQLNPVLAKLPPANVTMTSPQQLCLPVVKNGNTPPPDVLQLVQYIDLKCYLIVPPVSVGFPLTLSELDPVLTGIPNHPVTMLNNRQLCVPVQKNNQVIPAAVLNIVRWIDLEKYDISTPAVLPPVNLKLTQIDPLNVSMPPEPATISAPAQLGVPVAKNGAIPPG